jgi:hypothetical protein
METNDPNLQKFLSAYIHCARCRKETRQTQMSRFNTDICCPDCIDKEKEHPKYREAADAELAEVKKGNMNFPGIGKPSDL